MDISDRATQQEELARAKALEFRASVPAPTGFCFNCGIELDKKTQCFCDADCRDDFEVAAAARLRNGQ